MNMLQASLEMFHLNLQATDQQIGKSQFHMIGYVSDYDEDTHAIKAYIPQLRDEDNIPQQTGWVQLGTMMTGKGWGDIYRPKAGATKDNPTGGEQVLLGLIYKNGGMYVCGASTFNDTYTSPGKKIPVTGQPIQPGERYIQHESGTYIYLQENGDIRIGTKQVQNADGDLFADIAEDANVEIHRDLNLTVDRDVMEHVLRDIDLTVDRDWIGSINRNMDLRVMGDMNVFVTGNFLLDPLTVDVITTDTTNFSCGTDFTVEAGGLADITAGGTMDFTAGGDITVTTTGNLTAAGGTIDLNSSGIVTITAPLCSLVVGNTTIGTGALVPLIKSIFLLLYNAHTHTFTDSHGDTGTTSPPTVLATSGVLTTQLDAS